MVTCSLTAVADWLPDLMGLLPADLPCFSHLVARGGAPSFRTPVCIISNRIPIGASGGQSGSGTSALGNSSSSNFSVRARHLSFKRTLSCGPAFPSKTPMSTTPSAMMAVDGGRCEQQEPPQGASEPKHVFSRVQVLRCGRARLAAGDGGGKWWSEAGVCAEV